MKYDIESIKKRKQNEKKLKKITDIVLTILIYNIVIVVLSCMNKINPTNILGYRAFIISTSSMQPTINVGDIVIIKKADKNMLNKGDIITYYKDNQYITHRIIDKIQIEGQEERFITKGDNNNIEDSEGISYEEIEGTLVTSIPYVGNIIRFLENRIVFLTFVLGILILMFLKVVVIEKKENRREKKEIEKQRNMEEKEN